MTKSKAEKFRGHILQAFETVLGSSVTIEIRCEAKKDARPGVGPSQMVMDPKSNSRIRMHAGVGSQAQQAGNEIVEIPASPREAKDNEHADNFESNRRGLTLADAATYRKPTLAGRRKPRELSKSQSIVRSKVSLAHVIQQAEGCAQRNGWPKSKAVSIAEKLEQENLYVYISSATIDPPFMSSFCYLQLRIKFMSENFRRLEPRSKSLLCWKATRVTRRKVIYLPF